MGAAAIGILMLGAAVLYPLGRRLDRRPPRRGWTEPRLWTLSGACLVLWHAVTLTDLRLPFWAWWSVAAGGVWSIVLVALLDLRRAGPPPAGPAVPVPDGPRTPPSCPSRASA